MTTGSVGRKKKYRSAPPSQVERGENSPHPSQFAAGPNEGKRDKVVFWGQKFAELGLVGKRPCIRDATLSKIVHLSSQFFPRMLVQCRDTSGPVGTKHFSEGYLFSRGIGSNFAFPNIFGVWNGETRDSVFPYSTHV